MRMYILKILLVTLPFLLFGACSTHKVKGATLVGTKWQLISIQSMDDSKAKVFVDDPKEFTMYFSSKGQVSFRLGCNRAVGGYISRSAIDHISGALNFGSIAATKALCPPPRLDERILRDLEYVRAYLLKDRKLYLTLMADGGVYEWLPLSE